MGGGARGDGRILNAGGEGVRRRRAGGMRGAEDREDGVGGVLWSARLERRTPWPGSAAHSGPRGGRVQVAKPFNA